MTQEIPIGRPYPPAETLPAVTVENEVVWVNSNLHSPFDIQPGQSCDLGMLFLMRNRKPAIAPTKTFSLGIMDGHNRSGLLGKVVFSDNDKCLFRDVDLKGIGMFGYTIHEDGRDTPRGLLDFDQALREAEMTEELHSMGIRTYRVIAIIQLRQLFDENSILRDINWFKENRVISPSRVPAISIRAFLTKTRLSDIDYGDLNGNNSQKNNISLPFIDGLAIVNWEYKVKLDPRDPFGYLKWLSDTIGRQLALLHHLGYYHTALSQHNVTIDGLMADCVSVVKSSDDSDYSANYRGGLDILMRLSTEVEMGIYPVKGARQQISNIYNHAYQSKLS